MYSVLIVGYGYVGTAVASIFFKKDSTTIVDPKFNNIKIKDLKNRKFDIVFVCVDTPKGDNFLTLNSVLKDLNKYMIKNTIVCCKSTATPEFYSNSEKKYNNIKVLYSPEYLSHWNNVEDFKNQEFIIMGGDSYYGKLACSILLTRLKKIKETRLTDIKTAALIKYSENAFLALKVTFANEIYKIHKKIKCTSKFEDFTEMLGLDKRIGTSHFQVPGRDGKFGWGGHCYNKDNSEFANFSNSELMKFVIELNKKHRGVVE